jgi:hypothetical protein
MSRIKQPTGEILASVKELLDRQQKQDLDL